MIGVIVNTAEDLTKQLDYYKIEGVTTSSYSKAKKMYNSTSTCWWLRSASSGDDCYFYDVYYSGYGEDSYPWHTSGVSPAFRIGQYIL